MIEPLVKEITDAVRARAQAGTLDEKSLAVAIMAQQDLIEYLERLEVEPLAITGTSTSEMDSVADAIAERMNNG